LHRHAGNPIPAVLSEQCQVDFSKDPALLYATFGKDHLACPAHTGFVRRNPSEFQRKIRFNRGAQFTWPAVIDIPSPVRLLGAQEVPNGLIDSPRLRAPEEIPEHDVFRGDGHVRLQLSHPETFRSL